MSRVYGVKLFELNVRLNDPLKADCIYFTSSGIHAVALQREMSPSEERASQSIKYVNRLKTYCLDCGLGSTARKRNMFTSDSYISVSFLLSCVYIYAPKTSVWHFLLTQSFSKITVF